MSWLDATAFCDWLTQWKGLPKDSGVIRLPTEAEWEYACLADGDGILQRRRRVGAGGGGVVWGKLRATKRMPWTNGPKRIRSASTGCTATSGNGAPNVFDPMAYRKRPDGWVAREWTLQDAGADVEGLGDKNPENASRVLRGGSCEHLREGRPSGSR